MDDFEKHIREHTHQFDDHKADKTKLWKQIESKLDDPKPKVFSIRKATFLKIAASILIIFGVFSIAKVGLEITRSNDTAMNQELKDIDSYYRGLVSFQVQLVKNNKKLSSEDKEEFLSFMEELDKEYLLLKEEMSKNLDNQYILEAIIDNYKKRIDLIENLLEQLNNTKKIDTNEGYIL